MGMTQRKCPRCKKKRRFAEIKRTKFEKQWVIYKGVLVCFMCRVALVAAGESTHPFQK